MREIKFRGFVKGIGWKYGSLIISKDRYYITDLNCYVVGSYVDHLWEVDSKSIGQFTGLKDKNGVEIYEGDIVKDYDRNIEIYWENSIYGFYGLWLELQKSVDLPDLNNFEVIGNIYENKELL